MEIDDIWPFTCLSGVTTAGQCGAVHSLPPGVFISMYTCIIYDTQIGHTDQCRQSSIFTSTHTITPSTYLHTKQVLYILKNDTSPQDNGNYSLNVARHSGESYLVGPSECENLKVVISVCFIFTDKIIRVCLPIVLHLILRAHCVYCNYILIK